MPDGEWMQLTHIELKKHWEDICLERRRVTDVRLRAHDRVHDLLAKDLVKQAEEYARRLKELNGEAAALKAAHAESRDELKQMQSRYLLESRFDQYLADRKGWEAQRQLWEQGVSKQLDTYRGFVAAWGAVVVVIGLLLKFVPIGP